jgi:hypothetical protein
VPSATTALTGTAGLMSLAAVGRAQGHLRRRGRDRGRGGCRRSLRVRRAGRVVGGLAGGAARDEGRERPARPPSPSRADASLALPPGFRTNDTLTELITSRSPPCTHCDVSGTVLVALATCVRDPVLLTVTQCSLRARIRGAEIRARRGEVRARAEWASARPPRRPGPDRPHRRRFGG